MFSPYLRLAALTTLLSVCGFSLAQEVASSPLVAIEHSSLAADDQQKWVSAIGNDRNDRLSRMLDVHDPSQLLQLTAPNGKSALMVASKKGDLRLARELLAAGADIHEKTQTDGTAFMFAVLGNKRILAQWLVEKGADIHTIGSNGWTALTIAAAKGNVELLDWLISLGADAQVRDVYRFTPFLRAVDNGYDNVASLLLSLPETDINAQDEYDNTALHHAVSAHNEKMILLLMKYDADIHLVNRDGVSAFELAKGISALEALLGSDYSERPQHSQESRIAR